MNVRRSLPSVLRTSLLAALAFSAAPLGATPLALEDECCGACDLKSASIEDLIASYLDGELPDSFCGEKAEKRAEAARMRPVGFYGEMIAYRKDAPYFAEALVTHYTAKGSDTKERRSLLDLAAYVPKKQFSKDLVAELWDTDAKAFEVEHLIVFGERGPETMREQIAKRAKKEVLPAAYLALRGKDVGAKVLKKAVAKLDLEKSDGCEAAMAALALHELGVEEALPTVRDRFEEAALAALDAGDLERARELALCAEFFCKKLVKAGKKAELPWLADRAKWHVAERSTQVADADGVFAVIEGLRG